MSVSTLRSSKKQLREEILDCSSSSNFIVFHLVLMGQIHFDESTINLNSWKLKTMGLNNGTTPINSYWLSVFKKHYQKHKYSHFLIKKKVWQIHFKIIFCKIMFQAPILFWRKKSMLDFTEVVLCIFATFIYFSCHVLLL